MDQASAGSMFLPPRPAQVLPGDRFFALCRLQCPQNGPLVLLTGWPVRGPHDEPLVPLCLWSCATACSQAVPDFHHRVPWAVSGASRRAARPPLLVSTRIAGCHGRLVRPCLCLHVPRSARTADQGPSAHAPSAHAYWVALLACPAVVVACRRTLCAVGSTQLRERKGRRGAECSEGPNRLQEQFLLEG